jgi:hypothetical protein
MPVVTGLLRHPITGEVAANEWITFRLVDSEGNPVKNAYLGADPIVRFSKLQLSSTGYYSATLPATVSITPDGTRWEREHRNVRQSLIVPVSGTSAEGDILAEPLDAVSPAALTSLVDQTIFTSGTSLAVVFTALTAVPNSSVTVPNMAQTAELRGHLPIKASFVGAMAVALGPASTTSLGSQIETAWVYSSATGTTLTVDALAWVAPNTPGDYQLYVYAASGTITTDVSVDSAGSLTVYAV